MDWKGESRSMGDFCDNEVTIQERQLDTIIIATLMADLVICLLIINQQWISPRYRIFFSCISNLQPGLFYIFKYLCMQVE